MAVSTQNNVDADGPELPSRNENAHIIQSIDNNKITPDCPPTLDHSSCSNSDPKDMEKDVQKPGRSEIPMTPPKRSKRNIAMVMTALAACYAKLYTAIERASIANTFSS